jgi:hypothetical protein
MKIAVISILTGVAKELAKYGFIGFNMKIKLTKIKSHDTTVIKREIKDSGIDLALKKANIIMVTKNNIDNFK